MKLLTMVALVLIPTQLFADVCFSPEVAKDLLVEIETGRANTELMDLCNESLVNKAAIIDSLNQEIRIKETNNAAITKALQESNDIIAQKQQEIRKIQDNVPSRALWFATGSAATLLTLILSFVLVSK